MTTASSPFTKITSKGIKGYLGTQKKPSQVVGMLERQAMTRPLDKSRRQDVLHPSEIVNAMWCIRDSYYVIEAARKGEALDPERPSLQLRSIFDVGHAAHAKWQSYLAEADALYGIWKCIACETPTNALTKMPSHRCAVCGAGRWVYDELPLFDDEHLIHGSTDGWVIPPDGGEDVLLEVKTIGLGTVRVYEPTLLDSGKGIEDVFKEIRRPFSGHVMQLQMYLWLLHQMHWKGLLERTPPRKGVFLYENKANQAYREFAVDYAPEKTAEVRELALDVEWALRIGKPPACNISPQFGCSKCNRHNTEENPE